MNEETLFADALSRPPEERPAFLDAACAGRPDLRAAVDALLAAHEKPGHVLDQPMGDPEQTLIPTPARLSPTPPATKLRSPATRRSQPPRPPTITGCPRPAPPSRAATPSRRRSARAAWARSGSRNRTSP